MGLTEAMVRYAVRSEYAQTVEDVLARGRKTAPKTKEEKPVKRVAPKYRNPLNADETWTGRGKPPRWVQEKISRGITLEDMLI